MQSKAESLTTPTLDFSVEEAGPVSFATVHSVYRGGCVAGPTLKGLFDQVQSEGELTGVTSGYFLQDWLLLRKNLHWEWGAGGHGGALCCTPIAWSLLRIGNRAFLGCYCQ